MLHIKKQKGQRKKIITVGVPFLSLASAIRKSQRQDTELDGYQPRPAGLILTFCLFT